MIALALPAGSFVLWRRGRIPLAPWLAGAATAFILIGAVAAAVVAFVFSALRNPLSPL